jgi:hypothetical protein
MCAPADAEPLAENCVLEDDRAQGDGGLLCTAQPARRQRRQSQLPVRIVNCLVYAGVNLISFVSVRIREYLRPQGRTVVVPFDSSEELHPELHLLHERALAERKSFLKQRLQQPSWPFGTQSTSVIPVTVAETKPRTRQQLHKAVREAVAKLPKELRPVVPAFKSSTAEALQMLLANVEGQLDVLAIHEDAEDLDDIDEAAL